MYTVLVDWTGWFVAQGGTQHTHTHTHTRLRAVLLQQNKWLEGVEEKYFSDTPRGREGEKQGEGVSVQ